MNISALIVAAGKGSRMNLEQNKLYLTIRGQDILTRSILAFEKHTNINEIVVVANETELEYLEKRYIDDSSFQKVTAVIAGGKERQDSVYLGLSAINKNCDIILIHDGARPFIEDVLIDESITAAKIHGAACLAVPVKDTIKKIDCNGFIDETFNREMLWAVQTPQTFKYDIIKKAHELAKKNGFKGTDDTYLVEKMGERVVLVPSSYDNIKITTIEDIELAEIIAKRNDK